MWSTDKDTAMRATRLATGAGRISVFDWIELATGSKTCGAVLFVVLYMQSKNHGNGDGVLIAKMVMSMKR